MSDEDQRRYGAGSGDAEDPDPSTGPIDDRFRSADLDTGSKASGTAPSVGGDRPRASGVDRGGSGVERGDPVGGTVDPSLIAEAERLEFGQAWLGPMPDPETLIRYDEIVPGAAERILQMAEVAAKGNHEIASKLADAEIETAKQGLNLAFTLAFTAMVAAIVFFAISRPVAGGVLLSMPVVLLVRAILRDRPS